MAVIGRLGFGDVVAIRRNGVAAEAVVSARYGEPAKVVLAVGRETFTVLESDLLATMPPEVVEVDVAQARHLAELVLSGRGSHQPVSSQLRLLAASVLALWPADKAPAEGGSP